MKFIKKILLKLRGEPDLDKLIKRGLKIGSNFKMMGGCIIDPSHCWHIEIGDNVTLAPRVHILAHDASTKIFLDYTKVGNVKIGNNVFVGAGSIILPGVVIGDNVVIGAGSIVTKGIPDNSVVIGAPARIISSLKDFLEKERNNMSADNCFNQKHTLRNPKFGDTQRKELLAALKDFNHLYVK